MSGMSSNSASSRRLKKEEQKDTIKELSQNMSEFLWEGDYNNYNTVVDTIHPRFVPFIWL